MKQAPFVVEFATRREGPWRDAMPRGVCWQRAKDAYTSARNFWLSAEGAGMWVRVVRIGGTRAVHTFNPRGAQATRDSDTLAERWGTR